MAKPTYLASGAALYTLASTLSLVAPPNRCDLTWKLALYRPACSSPRGLPIGENTVARYDRARYALPRASEGQSSGTRAYRLHLAYSRSLRCSLHYLARDADRGRMSRERGDPLIWIAGHLVLTNYL